MANLPTSLEPEQVTAVIVFDPTVNQDATGVKIPPDLRTAARRAHAAGTSWPAFLLRHIKLIRQYTGDDWDVFQEIRARLIGILINGDDHLFDGKDAACESRAS